jgi:hypothetical protein
MERATLPRAALGWVLRSANRAVPVDTIAPGRMLLTHLLAVHAVDGHGAGLYRWSGSALESRTSGEEASTCELSAFLCLGGRSRRQCLHRLRVRRPRRGPRRARSRGYRAAHVEAGIVHGRPLLCAHALANGATGLTFFRRSGPRRVRDHGQLPARHGRGAPACRSRPGGWPRHSVELAGYDALMTRLQAGLRR